MSVEGDAFRDFRALFRDWTGMLLRPSMWGAASASLERIAARLRAPRDRLIAELRQGAHREEARTLIDEVAIHTTWFDREEPGVQALVEVVRAAAAPGATVRVWSAGCSTGEEPLSIAMALLDAGFEPRVLGTDVSPMAIAVARRARYSERAASGIRADRRARYFEQVGGQVRARERLRSCINYVEHDVRTAPPTELRQFDAVVCRNVLIYYARDDAARTLGRLAAATSPTGHILVAAAEVALTWLCRDVAVDTAQPTLLRPASSRPRPAAAPPTLEPPRRPPAVVAAAPLVRQAYERLRRADVAGAIELTDRVLGIDPLLPLAHLIRGLANRQRGELRAAAQSFRDARLLAGDDAWMSPYHLGLCLEQLGDTLDAAEAFRQALAGIEAGAGSGLEGIDADADALAATVAGSCRARLSARAG